MPMSMMSLPLEKAKSLLGLGSHLNPGVAMVVHSSDFPLREELAIQL